jgi:hypothetical protein
VGGLGLAVGKEGEKGRSVGVVGVGVGVSRGLGSLEFQTTADLLAPSATSTLLSCSARHCNFLLLADISTVRSTVNYRSQSRFRLLCRSAC